MRPCVQILRFQDFALIYKYPEFFQGFIPRPVSFEELDPSYPAKFTLASHTSILIKH